MFSLILIFIPCNDFDSYNGGNLQAIIILSVLIKVFLYSLSWQRSQ